MKKNFVIVGLGLIGGSLAAAISKYIPHAHLIGASRDPKKINFAKKKKWIHEGHTNLKSAVVSADYIFICTPVNTIPKLVLEVDRYSKPGALVTDVGSTKAEIVRTVSRKKMRHIQFVGSHPLAGSHLTGVQHATPNLFDKAFVFVTPSRKTSSKAVRNISLIWRKLKMKVKVLSPEAHDQLVSQISHLPHAMATVLMHAVFSKVLNFVASGFLDTTRIAQGDPELWTPIFMTNKANLVRDLSRLEGALTKLRRFIDQGNQSALRSFLKNASLKRSKLA